MTTMTLDDPTPAGRLDELVDRRLAALFRDEPEPVQNLARPSTKPGGCGSPAIWTGRWRCSPVPIWPPPPKLRPAGSTPSGWT